MAELLKEEREPIGPPPEMPDSRDDSFLEMRMRIGLAGLGLLVILGAYYYALDRSKEHLIGGVPYMGSYSGTQIATGAGSAAYSILQYWGDTRFTTKQVAEQFPYAPYSSREPGESGVGTSYLQIRDFFQKNGYTVTSIKAESPSDIRKLLEGDTPIIISQQISLDARPFVGVTRTIIGYSNKERAFIVHDYNFGNNYKIAYDTFEKLRDGYTKNVLVVTPTKEIKAQLKGLDPDRKYPERLKIMDSPSIARIQTKWAEIDTLRRRYLEHGIFTAPEIVTLYEEILAEPGFIELHPAAQMYASLYLAWNYTNNLEEHQKAEDVLEEVTLPLLKLNFGEPFGEWERPNPEIYDNPWWYAKPWVLYGFVEERLGKINAAREAFKTALQVDPSDEEALAQLALLSL